MTKQQLRDYEQLAAAQPPPVREAMQALVAAVRTLLRRQEALTAEVDRVLDQAPGTFGKLWPYDVP